MNKTKWKDIEKDFALVLNRYSVEIEADVPDFILAEFLVNCLKLYNRSLKRRDRWFGISDIWSWRVGGKKIYLKGNKL